MQFSDPKINVISICLSFSKQRILIIGIEYRMFILGGNPKETGKEGKPPKKGVMSRSPHWAPEASSNQDPLKSCGESISESCALGIYPLVLVPCWLRVAPSGVNSLALLGLHMYQRSYVGTTG